MQFRDDVKFEEHIKEATLKEKKVEALMQIIPNIKVPTTKSRDICYNVVCIRN